MPRTPRVPCLGPAEIVSPLGRRFAPADGDGERPSFTADDALVLREIELPRRHRLSGPRAFERAGPREHIFFSPKYTTAGIVSAGGICPGINDVIRSIVLELFHGYGVERILGFRYGFAGLDADAGYEPVPLGPDAVRDVHVRGGTFLGTSRGARDPAAIVDTLTGRGVSILFVIGGDGTMRAAHRIHDECSRRGAKIAVVGVPKTIDNDIPFVDKTFGFDTAVATARLALDAAYAEAQSVEGGLGLVKLMGRNAGFIAAQATLASHDVNACLIPEVPFDLEGDHGLLAWLEQRLATRRHAVVVVAEGCGASLVGTDSARDASGNVRYTSEAIDIGRHLKGAIEAHFTARQRPLVLKYFDPSYLVRATRASAEDATFCDALARNAVHAAMAGKTDMMVGRWHRCFTHVALPDVLSRDKRVDVAGDLWREVLESTGQPRFCA